MLFVNMWIVRTFSLFQIRTSFKREMLRIFQIHLLCPTEHDRKNLDSEDAIFTAQNSSCIDTMLSNVAVPKYDNRHGENVLLQCAKKCDESEEEDLQNSFELTKYQPDGVTP